MYTSGGGFEPHTIQMPQLHSTCFQSGRDIDSDDSHSSCVAHTSQPTCLVKTIVARWTLSRYMAIMVLSPFLSSAELRVSDRVWNSLVVVTLMSQAVPDL